MAEAPTAMLSIAQITAHSMAAMLTTVQLGFVTCLVGIHFITIAL